MHGNRRCDSHDSICSMSRYDVKTKTFRAFVPQGGGVIAPWFLSFMKTDPATLAYGRAGRRGTGKQGGD